MAKSNGMDLNFQIINLGGVFNHSEKDAEEQLSGNKNMKLLGWWHQVSSEIRFLHLQERKKENSASKKKTYFYSTSWWNTKEQKKVCWRACTVCITTKIDCTLCFHMWSAFMFRCIAQHALPVLITVELIRVRVNNIKH